MSNKIYTSVPVPKFPRNVFSLSRPVIGSMRMHRLYPTEILEVIPGDAFNLRQETFVRTAPLVAPPLAKVTVSHHAFFVPGWQLHREFDDFITGGEDPSNPYSNHMPYTTVSELYKVIDSVLSAAYNALDNAADFTAAPDLFKSQDYLEKLVSLIEGLDYSRSCPFAMPEFQPIQTVGSVGNVSLYRLEDVKVSDFTNFASDVAKLKAISYANWNAWRRYNPATLDAADLRINLLPFYAQLKVYCEYFRDENLCLDLWERVIKQRYYDIAKDSVAFTYITGNYDASGVDPSDFDSDALQQLEDILAIFSVHRRAWRKDRFTSALPWTQKGPDITIPLTGTVPVSVNRQGSSQSSRAALWINADSVGTLSKGSAPGYDTQLVGTGDLSQATGLSTMRDLRRAEAIEEFEEADGRFGNRYPENTLGQFGVFTPDSRLPRASFLGSTSQTVGFGEIPQTSETSDPGTPLGTLAGKGTSYSPGFLFKRRFTMHGFVVIFTSIQVSAIYEQGIHPMFSRYDRTEYAWPRYARLGEEPLYTKELFVDSDVDEDEVFGYAPRYSSYKSDTGSVHGQMKTTLNYWTFSRKFGDKPQLNEEFIYNDPRRDAFALTNPFTEQFYFEIDWKVRSSRLLPFFGVSSI